MVDLGSEDCLVPREDGRRETRARKQETRDWTGHDAGVAARGALKGAGEEEAQ